MVLCDGLKESDEEPDVFNLIGVRAVVEASSFPALCPRLYVFLHLSGHQGETSCHIEIDRTETNEVIYETASKTIKFRGPGAVVPVYFRVRNCVFPAPGVYYVQIFNDGKLIGERPLYLRQEE